MSEYNGFKNPCQDFLGLFAHTGLMKSFADRLKEMREEKDLNKSELAKIIGCDHTAIRRWEENLQSPSIDVLVALADYFKVTTDYMLGRTES